MAVLSVAQARKYVKDVNFTDEQLAEMLALMEEFAWTLLNE